MGGKNQRKGQINEGSFANRTRNFTTIKHATKPE